MALVNDHELVVKGLAAMFVHYAQQVRVVDLQDQPTVDTEVDIALYDSFGPLAPPPDAIAALCRNRLIGKVAVYTWRMSTEAVQTAAALGVSGYLSKGLPARDLVDALVRIHRGEKVLAPHTDDEIEQVGGDWPGRVEGLSNREAELLALVVAGHTNKEISERLYLSGNSIKSYIRSTYAKIGVTRRSQAVKWGIEHGFAKAAER